MRQPLGAKPVYTNIVKNYSKHKTKDGYLFDSEKMKRYYSSLDAELYFGNDFVDEIVFFTFTLQQQQAILYGYNSYVYDEIAQGSRIIQGQFAINFTSPNYLFDLLKAAKESTVTMGNYSVKKVDGDTKVSDYKTGNSVSQLNDYAPVWAESFDIDIIFGQKTAIAAPCHIVLEGVKIMSLQHTLNTSGEPISELYNFVAKDMKTIT